jgi:NAD(P)-dependent dehydrogenase (short-subunit alcohol dehydrogenase family)
MIDAHLALIEGIRGRLGPIHCLVNNAGVTSMIRGDLLDVTLESFDRCVGTNDGVCDGRGVERRRRCAPR